MLVIPASRGLERLLSLVLLVNSMYKTTEIGPLERLKPVRTNKSLTQESFFMFGNRVWEGPGAWVGPGFSGGSDAWVTAANPSTLLITTRRPFHQSFEILRSECPRQALSS